MDCLKCRRKYDLCSVTIPKSGKLLRTNRWVKKCDLTAGGLALVGKDLGPGDQSRGKRLEGVKARPFELQAAKPRILKNRF